jgi:hypothetical protein
MAIIAMFLEKRPRFLIGNVKIGTEGRLVRRMTHVILKIREQLIFDGNGRLLDKHELQDLMFNTITVEPSHRILVEITVKEEVDPAVGIEAGEKKQ